MTFWEAKSKLEAFEKAEKFMAEMIKPKSAKELIASNLRFFRQSIHDEDRDAAAARHLDSWLSHLFTTSFTYWPQYNLLGATGMEWPKNCMRQAAGAVYFQNSCDQDYRYDSWPVTPFFQDRLFEVREMSAAQIIEQSPLIDIDEKVTSEKLEYARRSMLYERVYKDLDLESWLYEPKSDSFQRFAMCAITSSDDGLVLYSLANYMLNHPVSDWG